MLSDTRKRFNKEFRKNLDAGNKTFEFEGKMYSTETGPSMPKNPPLPPKRRGMTLDEAYEKPSSSLPEKYAPKKKESMPDIAPMKTETGRLSEALSASNKARDKYARTQPTERNSRMLSDIQKTSSDLYSAAEQRGQGYAKGGMVRGCGKATKGRGKGTMY